MLAGSAAEWFSNASSTIVSENRMFARLARLMSQQFGPTLSAEEKTRKIMTRTKHPEETYAEYAAELRKIGMDLTIEDRFFVTAFTEGVDAATDALRQ